MKPHTAKFPATMPVDSPFISTNTTATVVPTTAAATTSSAAITNQAPSRPISQTNHLHYSPQALYAAQPFPVRTPNLHQDPSQPILYPVASSCPIRPLPADQPVTVANSAAYPHLPVVNFMSHPMHLARPPNLPQHSAISGSIKGAPNSSDLKTFTPSKICESNGCKEMRVKDDALCVVRDRKVRITDGASLYALCRSWFRNGSQEENQPQYGNLFGSLPRPLPILLAGDVPSQKKKVAEEVDEEDKDEGSIEQLSTQELLKTHVKRAKKVRSRLREDQLKRIERYKTRLALLLPPPVEQLRTDIITGS